MNRTGGPPALHQQLEHAAKLLQQVRAGASMPDALQRVPPPLRPGVQALGFHVMRWLGTAEAARDELAPKRPAPEVDALLTCALALMWPLEAPPYPAHTLVDEAVKCAARRAPRSKGFVNAVLRNALRRGADLQAQVQKEGTARYNHPAWWIRRVEHDWPTQASAILQAAQEHPPMTMRAHRRHGGRAALTPAWDAAEVAWQAACIPQAALPNGIPPPKLADAAVLGRAMPVERIPGFALGHWSVQDAAAQLAAPLLLNGLPSERDGQPCRVLDACAAPGGKTAHLLEQADLDLLALDADAQRLQRVADNLKRLQLPWAGGRGSVELKAADARAVDRWWDGRPFDAVLLDAPCSASGIVRRHPDARWLRRETDIEALTRIQAELLDALWPLVRPGGRLLYATCSVFRAEGAAQIDAFLQRQGLPSTVIDPASPGHLLPLVDNGAMNTEGASGRQPAACDGFFYALLNKPFAA